jgi:hypothetical protein
MAPPVLFADATALVVDHLRSKLASDPGPTTPVMQKVPTSRPSRFVTVIRTGGPRLNLVVDGAQITVDSWGRNDEEAADLAQLSRAHVNAMRGTAVAGHAVYQVTEVGGPADLPDPASNQSRYRQSFIVAIRGAALQE